MDIETRYSEWETKTRSYIAVRTAITLDSSETIAFGIARDGFLPARPEFPKGILVQPLKPKMSSLPNEGSIFPLWALATFAPAMKAKLKEEMKTFFLSTLRFWKETEANGNDNPCAVFPPAGAEFFAWWKRVIQHTYRHITYPAKYSQSWMLEEVEKMASGIRLVPFGLHYSLWKGDPVRPIDQRKGFEEVLQLFVEQLEASEWTEMFPEDKPQEIVTSEVVLQPELNELTSPFGALVERLMLQRFDSEDKERERMRLAADFAERFFDDGKFDELYTEALFQWNIEVKVAPPLR